MYIEFCFIQWNLQLIPFFWCSNLTGRVFNRHSFLKGNTPFKKSKCCFNFSDVPGLFSVNNTFRISSPPCWKSSFLSVLYLGRFLLKVIISLFIYTFDSQSETWRVSRGASPLSLSLSGSLTKTPRCNFAAVPRESGENLLKCLVSSQIQMNNLFSISFQTFI